MDLPMPESSISGLVQIPSAHSFADTLERLESALTSRGLTVFARMDFARDAESVGLKMNPTRLTVFGSPRAGTPLMVAVPSLAIDLPLKILVSQDGDGRVWVTYNSPDYLADRHHVPPDLARNVSGIVPIAESVAR
jgi:uncharacterized protein (DUF302 family)